MHRHRNVVRRAARRWTAQAAHDAAKAIQSHQEAVKAGTNTPASGAVAKDLWLFLMRFARGEVMSGLIAMIVEFLASVAAAAKAGSKRGRRKSYPRGAEEIKAIGDDVAAIRAEMAKRGPSRRCR